MKELSIFIDESGDSGEIKEKPAYYLVIFVFHDQDNVIEEQVSKLEKSVRGSGFDVEYIHTGPVIRREEVSVIAINTEIVKFLHGKRMKDKVVGRRPQSETACICPQTCNEER